MLFNVVFSWIIYQIYLFFKLFKCGKWHAKLASVTLATEKKKWKKNCRKMDNNGNGNAIGRVKFLTEPDAAFFWWMNKPKIFVSFQLEKKRRRMDGWRNELRKSQKN